MWRAVVRKSSTNNPRRVVDKVSKALGISAFMGLSFMIFLKYKKKPEGTSEVNTLEEFYATRRIVDTKTYPNIEKEREFEELWGSRSAQKAESKESSEPTSSPFSIFYDKVKDFVEALKDVGVSSEKLKELVQYVREVGASFVGYGPKPGQELRKQSLEIEKAKEERQDRLREEDREQSQGGYLSGKEEDKGRSEENIQTPGLTREVTDEKTQESVEYKKEETVEINQEEPVEDKKEETLEVEAEEAVEIKQEEPVEVRDEEPAEIKQKEAVEVSNQEPVEIEQLEVKPEAQTELRVEEIPTEHIAEPETSKIPLQPEVKAETAVSQAVHKVESVEVFVEKSRLPPHELPAVVGTILPKSQPQPETTLSEPEISIAKSVEVFVEKSRLPPHELPAVVGTILPKSQLQPETTFSEPEIPVSESETSPSKPEISVSESEIPISESETSPSEPEIPISEPKIPVSEPEIPISEPEIPISEPETSPSEPEIPISEPEIPISEPETSPSKPEIPISEPETPQSPPAEPFQSPKEPVPSPPSKPTDLISALEEIEKELKDQQDLQEQKLISTMEDTVSNLIDQVIPQVSSHLSSLPIPSTAAALSQSMDFAKASTEQIKKHFTDLISAYEARLESVGTKHFDGFLQRLKNQKKRFKHKLDKVRKEHLNQLEKTLIERDNEWREVLESEFQSAEFHFAKQSEFDQVFISQEVTLDLAHQHQSEISRITGLLSEATERRFEEMENMLIRIKRVEDIQDRQYNTILSLFSVHKLHVTIENLQRTLNFDDGNLKQHLESLSQIAQGDVIVASALAIVEEHLSPLLQRGVASLGQIQSSYSSVLTRASKAALLKDDSLTSWMLANLASLVVPASARNADERSPFTYLYFAGQNLERGDLKTALGYLEKLEGFPRDEVQVLIDDISARLALSHMLEVLSTHSISLVNELVNIQY